MLGINCKLIQFSYVSFLLDLHPPELCMPGFKVTVDSHHRTTHTAVLLCCCSPVWPFDSFVVKLLAEVVGIVMLMVMTENWLTGLYANCPASPTLYEDRHLQIPDVAYNVELYCMQVQCQTCLAGRLHPCPATHTVDPCQGPHRQLLPRLALPEC